MFMYEAEREVLNARIKKSKKICFHALRSNFGILLLCWFITAVVTFASWGVYVFIDFAGFFLDIPLDFISAGVGIAIVLPLAFGNVSVARAVIKGRKADIYLLFDGYFNLKRFWKWVCFYVISQAPGWISVLAVGAVSNNVQRLFPFFKGKWAFYIELVFEVFTLVLLFINLCKSLYFLSLYRIDEDTSEFFEKAEKRYIKRKKYFRKYILSNLHYIVILILARAFPLYAEALFFTFILGYFSLLVVSYSEGFEIKFKKYKFGRSEKRYEKR